MEKVVFVKLVKFACTVQFTFILWIDSGFLAYWTWFYSWSCFCNFFGTGFSTSFFLRFHSDFLVILINYIMAGRKSSFPNLTFVCFEFLSQVLFSHFSITQPWSVNKTCSKNREMFRLDVSRNIAWIFKKHTANKFAVLDREMCLSKT